MMGSNREFEGNTEQNLIKEEQEQGIRFGTVIGMRRMLEGSK